MNFDLTEDEEMLKAMAERFVADRYDATRRRAYLESDLGFSKDNWFLLGDLGLIVALFDEEDGGLALGQTGLATAFEALGRGLVVEPLIENVCLAGRLFARLAPSALKDSWMEGLLTGAKRLALAHREQTARRNQDWVETRARRDGPAAYLTGQKFLVPAGAGVDAYLVSARVAGAPGDGDGVEIFLIDPGADGLSVQPWRLIDGSLAVSLTLTNVRSQPLGGGLADIGRETLRASLLRSAEALGVMERLFAETLDYLRTRRQFGVPLASFQALQHRMVTQYAALEQSRALLNLAAMGDPADPDWAHRVDGARAYIAPASVTLGHEMMQMHGGMGTTDELLIGHGHKRLFMLSRWPDGPDESLDRYAGVEAGPAADYEALASLSQPMPRRNRV